MVRSELMGKLTSKRQVTIPKSVCDELGLEAGDMLDIFARGGVAHIVKVNNDAFGLWKSNKKTDEGLTYQEKLRDDFED